MTAVMKRDVSHDGSPARDAEPIAPLPDDTVSAILAIDPDVSVNELLRARGRARRLLAIYRAGAARAAEQNPDSPR